MTRRWQIAVLLIALGLYLVSLGLPALQCTRYDVVGAHVLATGWLGILVLDPRWYANLGFAWIVLSVLFKWRPAHPLVVLLIVACAIASPFLPAMGCGDGGGAPAMSTGLGVGGYAWIAGLLVAVVASIGYNASIPLPIHSDSSHPSGQDIDD